MKTWARFAFKRFVAAEIQMRAAALAFHSLLAIVPVVGIVFWYLSAIHLMDRWIDRMKHFVLAQLNVDSSSVFLTHFKNLTAKVGSTSWNWIILAIFLYTAWNLISKFGNSLDVILETQAHQMGRVKSKTALLLRRLAVMIGMPVAVTLSLAASHWVRKESLLKELFKVTGVGPVIALPLAWLAVIVAYFFVYHFVPKNLVPWKEALKAALVAGPTSEIVRNLFGQYNHYALSVHRVYGVFSVIPMFILWMQLFWLIALASALVIRFKPSQVLSPAGSKTE